MHDSIKVYDNFLNNSDFENIKTIMLSDGGDFPWYVSKILGEDNNGEILQDYLENGFFNAMMSHLFYENNLSNSKYFELINPILRKCDVISLIRAKANLYFGNNTNLPHGYHIDNHFKNCTTGIYFLNTNNGKFTFEDGKAIDAIENRIVLFDSQLRHSSSSCTDQRFRCTININFIDSRGLINNLKFDD